MADLNPRLEQSLRYGFKYVNHFVLLLWRLGLGRLMNIWPQRTGRVMVITHVGRISGAKYRTPLNYAVVDGDIYCTAGFGSISDWYQNIRVQPQVEVWLPDGRWAGIAEEVGEEEARLPILRQVLVNGGSIVVPMIGVDPRTASAEDLDAATANYRLIRIRCTEARTGPGGPGDWDWVWPVATFILLPFALFRRRR